MEIIDKFEYLNEFTWDDLSSIDSPSSTYSESESSSMTDEEKCEDLIISNPRDMSSEPKTEKISMTHYEQNRPLPIVIGAQKPSIYRRYSLPATTESATFKKTFTENAKETFSQSVVGISKSPLPLNDPRALSNSRTIITFPSVPGKRSLEFEIQLFPSDRVAPSSVANQSKWDYSNR